MEKELRELYLDDQFPKKQQQKKHLQTPSTEFLLDLLFVYYFKSVGIFYFALFARRKVFLCFRVSPKWVTGSLRCCN